MVAMCQNIGAALEGETRRMETCKEVTALNKNVWKSDIELENISENKTQEQAEKIYVVNKLDRT